MGRGSRRGVAVLIVLVVGAVAPRFGAAQIYKWTDSQGQVHYSDHAEPGQKTTTVTVPKAPPGPVPVSSQEMTPEQPDTPPVRPGGAGTIPQFVRNRQYPPQATVTPKQQAQDKALVEKCKANRDTYCNNMAEIKRQQQVENAPQPTRTRCENTYNAYGQSVGSRCWDQLPPPPPSPPKAPPPAYSRFGVPTKKKSSDD